MKPRTARQYRGDTAEFEAWLRSVGIPATVEAVTKKMAGRYVTDALSKEASRKTANRKISALSAYWRWLVKRGHAEANPWTNQSLSKLAAGDAGKRPFTDAELGALFTGETDAELRDAMLFAALSGMRIEEIYRLTAADCTGDWFNIRQAKTRAGIRRVPIHADLTAAVARRTKGADLSAFVFDEPGPARPGRERSTMASKRFGHYRQRVGVHDKADGRRQSRVDFHSFRRWFVTAARSGYDRAVVAAVVGHDVGNITDDTYSGGPSDAQRIACVNSVRLPDGCIAAPADAPASTPRRRTPKEAAPKSPQTSPARPASRP